MGEKKSEAKSVNFVMVGKIMKPKQESKWYEVKVGNKGETTLLNFNLKTNSNVFKMNLMGFLNNNENERIIYAFKREGDKNVKFNFLYSEKEKCIEEMSEFSKMVFKNDNDKKEFCHNTDFINYLKELIDNEEIVNKPIKIEGRIEYSRYKNKENKEVESKKYVPQRITLLNEGIEEKAEANIEMLFDENSILEGETEEIMILNGKVVQYDSKLGKDTLFDESIEFDFTGKGTKAIDTIKSKLNLGEKEVGKLNKIGLKVDLIRGSEDVRLTKEMLSDEEKDLVDFGLMTMEELEKEKGLGKGEFRDKKIFKGLVKGYSTGAILTKFNEEYFSTKMDDGLIGELFGENSEVINDDDLPF